MVSDTQKITLFEIEQSDAALFMKIMTSVVHELVTVYPTYKNNKICSVEQFHKIATELEKDL